VVIAGPEAKGDDFVRVRLGCDAIDACVLRGRAAGVAGVREVEGVPEQVDRRRLAEE
jgi:hypothetical protein